MTRSPFKLSLLALALLSCATSSWSMDLLQAYEAAKANDASIRASRAAADMGRERLPQARSQLLPSLTASVGTNRNQLSSGVPNSLGQIQSSDTDYPSSNRTVSLRQPLFRAYQMAQYRQAQAQVDDTEASLAQEEQDLAVRVSGAYFEAMLTHEQLALVLAQRASYSTQLAAAKQALVGGSGTRTDVDEAQARLDMTVASEIEARQSIDYTLRQLQTLVNQPINGLSRLDLSRFTLADPQPNQVESWIEKLELNNRHLQSLKAQVEAARKEVDKAQSGHTPTLDAVVQWSRSQSENVLNVQSSYTNKAIGLQLTQGVVDALARLDFACCVHVKTGLRLIDVGSGARAAREPLLCGGQLRAVGRALGQNQGQLFMRQHGLEIGAAHPYREILLVLRERGLCVVDLRLGLPVLGHLVSAEQGLAQGNCSVAAGVAGVAALNLPK